MLAKPFLAKCSNRNLMPKSHPTSGSPEDWFADEFLEEHNLTGIAFDFFVNWRSNIPSITPIIWIKRILLPGFTYQQMIENVEQTLVEEFGTQHLKSLKSFAVNNDFTIQFIIIKDDLNWSDSASEILAVDFKLSEDDGFMFNHSLITIEHFKTMVRNNSGGAIQIGLKGLTYGSSHLECHLSGTDSVYPGDVDLIILDSKSKPLCILEFKKHTLSTSISSQQLSNYYPDPDGRKYNRLAILKEYLSKNNLNIPIFIIYYPTRADFIEGRLELLTGEAGNLSTRAASNFILPADNSNTEYSKIIEKLRKAMAYHYSPVTNT
jgi:hypothetical protein